jgi:hypothetical protein
MRKQTHASRGGLAAFALTALFTACGGNAVLDPSPTGFAGGPPSANGGTDGGYSKPTAFGCNAGSISFKLVARAGSGTLYCVGDQSSCMPDWLSIRAVGGADLPLEPDRCKGSCNTCSDYVCDALCLEPTELGPSGVVQVFTGLYAPESVCGANMACNDSGCIAPGNYIAKFCGYPATLTGSVTDPTPQCENSIDNPACVEIPFTWPPIADGATLTATIGDVANDAGAAGASSD